MNKYTHQYTLMKCTKTANMWQDLTSARSTNNLTLEEAAAAAEEKKP